MHFEQGWYRGHQDVENLLLPRLRGALVHLFAAETSLIGSLPSVLASLMLDGPGFPSQLPCHQPSADVLSVVQLVCPSHSGPVVLYRAPVFSLVGLVLTKQLNNSSSMIGRNPRYPGYDLSRTGKYC